MTHDLSETPQVGVPAHLAPDMSLGEQADWVRSYVKAHPVSRRSALLGSVGSLGVLSLTATPFGQQAIAATRAQAAATDTFGVAGRHLGWGNDPTTSMWVSGELLDLSGARLRPSGLKVVLDLGLDHHYGHTIRAEVRELLSQVPVNGGGFQVLDQFFVHALVTHLKPGTVYHYRFRLSNGSVTPDATFTTAGSNGKPFTFTAFGDQGVNYDAAPIKPQTAKGTATSDYYSAADWAGGGTPTAPGGNPNAGSRSATKPNRTVNPAASLTGVVASVKSKFHLMCGDVAYADPSGSGSPDEYPAPAPASGFDAFDPSIWTAYFSQIEPTASRVPWMVATGNHDMEALYDSNIADGTYHGYHGHAARLNLLGGTQHSPSPSMYSFRYQNVAVVSVDCNDLSDEITVNRGYSGGRQAKWLEKTLRHYRMDPTIDFVVAWHHHCAFATSNSHHSDGGVRSVLGPLFHRYQVDISFQGHNHQFERTDPIRLGAHGFSRGTAAPDRSTVNGWHGTTYVTIGSGGRPRYKFDPTTGGLTAAGAVAAGAIGSERFRGNPNANGPTNVASGYWGHAASGPAPFVPQEIDWSQARYDDYAVAVVDVVPAVKGKKTTMTLRTLSDFGVEIDRVTLARVAGTGRIHGLA